MEDFMEEKIYRTGYREGVIDTLNRVDKWLDRNTIDSLREDLLK